MHSSIGWNIGDFSDIRVENIGITEVERYFPRRSNRWPSECGRTGFS